MRLPQCLNLTTSKTKQFCETSSFFELDNIQNEAILRDFFNFWNDNIKNKAILRDFFNFWNDNIKNKAILRDFLQKWKVASSADGLVPTRFVIFPLHLCKVLRLPWKGAVTQNHFSKSEDLMLQNATPLRTSAPGPPNSSDEDVSCTASATRNASFQILLTCSTPASYKTLAFCSLLRRCTSPCACHAKRHLNVQKWSEPWCL